MNIALPEWPRLAPIEFPLRAAIERLTSDFPLHGDFQFTALWAWDFGRGSVAVLNGNQVARLTTPSRRTFYTFCGTSRLADTATNLLAAAQQDGAESALYLVPSQVAQELDRAGFHTEPDRDHFDYLIPVPALAMMQGGSWQKRRHAANQFARRFSHSVIDLNLKSAHDQYRVFELVERWRATRAVQKQHLGAQLWVNDEEGDGALLQRFCSGAKHCEIQAIGIEVDSILVACVVSEVCTDGCAIVHYVKSDIADYPGATEALLRELGRLLERRSIHTLNFGSDDGLPGLRSMKLKLRPYGFVDKYTVRHLSADGG